MAQKSIQDLLKFSIINIDKPCGPTSFDVSHFVKKTLGINKSSHFGTLDPAVSGVLPVAISRACRLSDYFMHRNKTYIGIMRLHKEIPLPELKKEMETFVGLITQLPPVKSRVKRAPRQREIMVFEILEIDGKDVLFKAEVQAGTYIRKLCSDLGEKIGGAHMLELRRIQAGIFEESSSVNLYDFESAVKEYRNGNEGPLQKILIPADEAIKKVLPVVDIKSSSLKKILTGKPVHKSDCISEFRAQKGGAIAIFCGDKFIEVARVIFEGDVLAKPEFVFN